MAAKSKKPLTPPPPTGLAALFAYPRTWFLAGLLVLIPVLLTFSLIWWLVEVIDNNVIPLLPETLQPDTYLDFSVPGVGLLVAVIFIIFVGALTNIFIGRWIVIIGERIVDSLPVVRTVYGGIKQIVETVMASQSDAFREVVLIEYPRKGIWVIGFVTGKTRGEVQNRLEGTLINVFVPTTPNPTSGFLLFLPRSQTRRLDMTVEEAVKMVVSGGIVTPEDPRARPRRSDKTKTGAKTKAKAKTKTNAAMEKTKAAKTKK